MRARTRARLASCPHPPLHGNGVDLKRVPPKSRPTATAPGSILGLIPRWKRPARTPPSTFLFLPIHLSNSPATLRSPLSIRREPIREPTKRNPRHLLGGFFPHISEELQRRVRTPYRRRRVAWPGLYGRHQVVVNRERFDSLTETNPSRSQQLSGL